MASLDPDSVHWAVRAEYEESPGEAALPGCLISGVGFLVLVFTLAVSNLAHCQDRPEPMRGVNGAPGMWVPLEDFRLAVSDREALPRYVEQVRLLTESLSLAHTEIDSRIAAQAATDAEVEALGQSIQSLITQVTVANTRATAAETERDAWYRSPWLWGGLGLIVGILGVGAIAIGVST